MILTLEWTSEGVRFIDQTKLPLEETYVLATSYQQVADVIVTMVVRGAPAIGVSAAMGIALGAKQTKAATTEEFAPEFEQICALLAGTRPTAVNLFWAIDRMRRSLPSCAPKEPVLIKYKRLCSTKPSPCMTKILPHAKPWEPMALHSCRRKAE